MANCNELSEDNDRCDLTHGHGGTLHSGVLGWPHPKRIWWDRVTRKRVELDGVKSTADVEYPKFRLDVQNELIEAIRSGRMRIVSREDYVVNGQTLAKVTLEEVEDDEQAARDARR